MDFDIDLLKKFYRGDCTEEEANKVLKWVLDPSQRASVTSAIELYWYKFEAEETDKEKAVSSIKEKINARIIPNLEKKKRVFMTNKLSLWKSAAVVSLVFTVLYLLWFLNFFTYSPDHAISVDYTVKAAPYGQKLHTQLSDGSKVVLNSGSKISFSENKFIDSVRFVYLEGEAYFQIAKNDTVPFVVSTRNLTITALGTSFNVRTYTEDNKEYIAMETGKVSVKRNGPSVDEEIYLEPGEIVSFDKTTETLSSKVKFVLEEQLGWKDGLLSFNKENLSEVVKKLERWYGVHIVLLNNDRSIGWSYSGRFNNVALINVLQGISYTKSFDFEIRQDTVYIKF
jgi:transmembrane sensor